MIAANVPSGTPDVRPGTDPAANPFGTGPDHIAGAASAGIPLRTERTMNTRIDIRRGVAAGVVATAAMTAVGLWVAPLMGMPAMNPAAMLAASMGGMLALGWIAHFMIGTVLALIYAIVAPWLMGPPVLRGALYGIAPFLLAQLVVMPMMGMPIFSGSAVLAMGSLIGHLVYGSVVGGVYGPVAERAVVGHARRAHVA
jgi:uncharacterized membrane protein YagU involved in acid resistance